MIVYLNGAFIPKEEALISPEDRGFLFADGAYDVFHAYDGHLFRGDDHFRRMVRSLHELEITAPREETLREVTTTLLRMNNLEDGNAVVYMQITRGAAPRKHAFPPPDTPPTVYAKAFAHTVPRDMQDSGVGVILAPDIRWTRCDIKSVALLPNVLAHQRAKDTGAHEALFVRDGMITEGALTNVCAVFDGRVITYPKSPYILSGLTRAVVLELCESLGIPADESPILEHQLPNADEVFICNTTSEILPVIQIDGHPVKDGLPGPITRALQQAYRETTRP